MTLTEMLRSGLNMEPECDDEAQADEDTLNAIKDTFRRWLHTVGLPYYSGRDRDGKSFNITRSLQRLLATLVDEPGEEETKCGPV